MSFEDSNNKVMPASTFNKTNTTNLDNNMSGKGSGYPAPDSVTERFNWGAFALDWIWGLGNKSYITLITLPLWLLCFIPLIAFFASVLSIGLSIWFGIKGNEWAWQNKHFDSIDAFHNYQRKWAIAGVIYIVINIVLVPVIIAALTLPVLLSDTSAHQNNVSKLISANRIKETAMINEAMEEKCDLSSVGLAKCFEQNIVGEREGNTIKLRDNSILTFNGNGICQNRDDCNVTIQVQHDGTNDTAIIPLYLNSNGYIHVNEDDLKEYQNK